MVPADKLVSLDLAFAEKSTLVRTTSIERAPTGLGSDEGDIDSAG
jgi:hypothetical protein